MKLVIDIPYEDYYDLIEKSKQYSIDMLTKAQSSIIKGTPLDTVLDKAKAEIEQEYNRLNDARAFKRAVDDTLELGECLGLKIALRIIDKHKAESEE